MTLWEELILIIAWTVCSIMFISFGANAIVDAIDRYKDKRASKDMKLFATIMDQVPQVMLKTVDVITAKLKDEEEKERQKMEELLKKEE